MNYRNPKYVERYEDVVFVLNSPLTNPANNTRQIRTNNRIIVDNSGETTPYDWYHVRFNVDFKLTLLNGNNITVDDHNGMVNSAYSLIKKLTISMNGIDVYECSEANHATNIKNLIEYSSGYSKSQGTNEFFFLDINRNAAENKSTFNATPVMTGRNARYNKGFASRKALLGTSSTVNAEILLNRYSFFTSLHDEILPNSKIELKIEFESDNNLVWQAGADCRVIAAAVSQLPYCNRPKQT